MTKKNWLTTNLTFLEEILTLFQRLFFLLWSLSLSQTLLLKIELPNFIPSILVKDWIYIIFSSLLDLFSYAAAHDVQFFEKIIFGLEVFSYSFGIGLSQSSR